MQSSQRPSASGGLLQARQQARQLLAVIWHRRRLAVAVTWLAAVAAVPVIMLTPNRYEASARIYVDTQTVLKPLMEGLTYQPDIEQQLRMLARTVIARPNIEKLVDRRDLGLGVADATERERKVSRLMEQIKITPSGTGNLYAITYKDTDSARARAVVEATLELFVNAGAYGKKRDSEEAGQFIEEQIKDYEQKLAAAENRLKEFKVKNFGISGLPNQDYFVRVSTLSDEVNKLRMDLNAAEQSRDAYRKELAGESPQLPADAPKVALSGVAAELDARLEAQRKVLDELLRRYTEAHPDVVSTRRVIAQIEAQQRAEAERLKTSRPVIEAATSPVYQKIRIALAESEAQVAALRSQLNAKTAQLNEVRAVAGRVPLVEAELAQLNRDYDVMRKKYQELVSRRESAALSVKLDESSRLADFRVIEPARASPAPVFPARIHLGLLSILAAFACGIAAPLVADRVNPTFRDAKALQAATGRPVIGQISISLTEALVQRMRSQDRRLLGSLGVLLIAQIGCVAWMFSRTAW